MFNKAFDHQATCLSGDCCRCSLCSPTAMAQGGFFTTDQSNSGKESSKYTLQVGNCIKAQEKMLSRCISLSSVSTKRDSEKSPMFVDATPTADGNKRRLKLVAFCIAKPKLHLRSTLPIIVFK